MAAFADVQDCIYTDIVSGWVRKVQKYADVITSVQVIFVVDTVVTHYCVYYEYYLNRRYL